jgi:hypothetical protein
MTDRDEQRETFRCIETSMAKELEMLRAENERLRRILRAILDADERGQGTPFGEAMKAARKALRDGKEMNDANPC